MQPPHEAPLQQAVNQNDEALVFESLEPDQLAEVKKRHVPRRRLTRPELVVLSALRLYLLFMSAVVIYQVWSSVH